MTNYIYSYFVLNIRKISKQTIKFNLGRYANWYIPLIYVLSTNRKEITYAHIFAKLLELEPDLKPRRAMTDFEMAAVNAINDQFEGVSVSCCFFHLTKNMYKHIQAVGLQKNYNNSTEFAVNIRMLAALAFVPENDVIRAYEAIVSGAFWAENDANEANNGKQLFLNYFEKNYIGAFGRTQNQGRKTPRFPIVLWNMYLITISGLTSFLF